MKKSVSTTSLSVKEIFQRRTVPELVSIAKNLNLRGYSGKKKDSIVEIIVSKVTDKIFLQNLFLVIDRLAWSVILSARSSPVLIPDPVLEPCRTLANLGILQWIEKEDGIWVEMPEEIRGTFSQLESDGFLLQKQKADLLDSYALSVTHLYGIIRQDDFVSLFNSQNDASTDIDEMFSILIQHVSAGAPYGFWGEYLTHFLFEENEYKDAEDLLRSIEGKPQFSPSKEILLKYEDPKFFESNLFSERIELFLRRRLFCPEETISEILSDLSFACIVDAPLKKVASILEPYNLPVTEDLVRELFPLIINLSNHSRKWANRGFSPVDIRRQEELHQPIRKGKKIGRNEPCPCGSGKKYKKCCGR